MSEQEIHEDADAELQAARSWKLMAYLSPLDQPIIETHDEKSQPHVCSIRW